MGARPDYVVVGAGPAGAAFAYYAALEGYRVAVYDMAPAPAVKPCGWLIPAPIREYLRVPGEYVVQEVHGYRVYLDGELLGEEHGTLLGYHVDKPGLLRWLLEQADTHYSRYVPLSPPRPPVEPREGLVVAAGSYAAEPGADKIFAVQAVYRMRERLDPSTAEIWFESSHVGYYWVFPEDESRAKIGVGGYAPPARLMAMLERFAHERGAAEQLDRPRGAWIVVAGAKPELLDHNPPVIGEAAGFVYPISGEGIRPSIASAHALYQGLQGRSRPSKALKSIVAWIRRQRRLLDIVRRASPEKRAAVLRLMPPRLAVEIAMGTASIARLAAEAAKAPGVLARALAALLTG